jgi:hypothetical protein
MGQYPKHLTDEARRLGDTLPNAPLVDWNSRQQKPCIAQPRKIRRRQRTPALAFPPLRGELGGQCTDILTDLTGFHHDTLPVGLWFRSGRYCAVVAHRYG